MHGCDVSKLSNKKRNYNNYFNNEFRWRKYGNWVGIEDKL